MPGKNGKEVYAEISRLKPDIKALFMSGYTANIIHKKGVLESATEFISKPFSPNAFLRKVREVLDKPVA
jgi:response regulator RpfG family c-di-GMP phosphodiesterase